MQRWARRLEMRSTSWLCVEYYATYSPTVYLTPYIQQIKLLQNWPRHNLFCRRMTHPFSPVRGIEWKRKKTIIRKLFIITPSFCRFAILHWKKQVSVKPVYVVAQQPWTNKLVEGLIKGTGQFSAKMRGKGSNVTQQKIWSRSRKKHSCLIEKLERPV